METTVADWSSLPRDLLVSIAKLTLVVLEDFMAFRATCSSWNEAGGDDECLKSVTWPRVPFLMIPDRAKFYSLSRKKSHSMRTPLPESKCRLSRKKSYSKRAPLAEEVNKKCRKFIESRFGWVLAHSTSGEADLLYPFSGERIQLPNFKTMQVYHGHNYECHVNDPFIGSSVLSANPFETSDYVLVVISAFYMSFWRPGDRDWTGIGSARGETYRDLTFYSKDRKFYAISQHDKLWVWDMASDSAVLAMVFPSSYCKPRIVNRNLVESSSTDDLLMVRVDLVSGHYEVHRLDVVRGEVERVESRLKDAIFIGINASFSIVPEENDQVIKSNCIYFATEEISRPDSTHCTIKYDYKNKPYHLSNYMGIYNLEDQTAQLFPPTIDSLCFFTTPPLWIAPSSLSFLAKPSAPNSQHN